MRFDALSDDQVNFTGLVKGDLMLICRHSNFGSPLILLSKNSDYSEKYEMSQEGKDYLASHPVENPSKTSFVAKIEYLRVTKKNRMLWEELKNIREFYFWNISRGPELFNPKYLAIYRVYKLPFEIDKSDFNHILHGRFHIKEETKKETWGEIQTLFEKNELKPIVPDDVFEIRVKKIKETIKNWV